MIGYTEKRMKPRLLWSELFSLEMKQQYNVVITLQYRSRFMVHMVYLLLTTNTIK